MKKNVYKSTKITKTNTVVTTDIASIMRLKKAIEKLNNIEEQKKQQQPKLELVG